jgi:hypothetical protein
MFKWRVYIHIKGAPSRPSYDGHKDVETNTDDAEAAGERAVRELMRGAFQDVGRNSFVIEKIERR